jgi:adenosylcobinamide-phosphate synthase
LIESILLNFGLVGVVLAGVLASTTIANKMLFDSVKETISTPSKIRYLVSRDTKDLTPSEINRASIETFAENLSDGVIAPLLYLAIFGLSGAFIYKAINTLDSMVGYKTPKYKNFGKVSAKLDDIANFIPARVTAFLIALLSGKRESFLFFRYGKLHDSPNAGYPISAMALALGVKLGGSCYYFGELKEKPFFGRGRAEILSLDIERALSFKKKIDSLILGVLVLAIYFSS